MAVRKKKTKAETVSKKHAPKYTFADGGIILLFVGICLLAGGLGSIFTMPQIGTWYAALNKPFFSPPNWVFGPVWTLLYILMGVALFLVWKQGIRRIAVNNAIAWFVAQLALNVFWSAVFFGMQSPLGGFVIIVMLWASLALTALQFAKISRGAALLLAPYLLWVSFAMLLNFAVMVLNP